MSQITVSTTAPRSMKRKNSTPEAYAFGNKKARKATRGPKPKIYPKNYHDGPESKYFDTDVNFLIDATGEVPVNSQLCLIPQGDSSTTRDGRQAMITSIQLKGRVRYAPAGSATAATVAVMYIILDKQCNGAAATSANIFTTTNVMTQMLNLDNSERFQILKKFTFPFQASAGVTGAYNDSIAIIDYYKKCSIPITWDNTATTGAIATIRSNNLFIYAGANSTEDDLTDFAGTCRLRFTG